MIEYVTDDEYGDELIDSWESWETLDTPEDSNG